MVPVLLYDSVAWNGSITDATVFAGGKTSITAEVHFDSMAAGDTLSELKIFSGLDGSTSTAALDNEITSSSIVWTTGADAAAIVKQVTLTNTSGFEVLTFNPVPAAGAPTAATFTIRYKFND